MDVRRILLVEDQEDIRWLVRETLDVGSHACILREAVDGSDAINTLVDFAPQIAILDVMLPGGIDGFSLCEYIRQHPLLGRSTFVILLTARGQRSDQERGLAAGADLYLIKPFSPIELLKAVEDFFSSTDSSEGRLK